MKKASPVPSNTDFNKALRSCKARADSACCDSATRIRPTEQAKETKTRTMAVASCTSAIPAASSSTTSGKISDTTWMSPHSRRSLLFNAALDAVACRDWSEDEVAARMEATRNGMVQHRSHKVPLRSCLVDWR